MASQVLFVKTGARDELWRIAAAIDRVAPLYLAVLFSLSDRPAQQALGLWREQVPLK